MQIILKYEAEHLHMTMKISARN